MGLVTLSFDLETGMRVATKMGNLRSEFRHANPSGSRVNRYLCDRWTDIANLTAPSYKNATDARIESIACIAFLACTVFWLRHKPCICCIACAAYDSLKLHVAPWVGLCDIKLFTFLWWVSGSAVRRNVVMSNYVMNNYVTLRFQWPVCQFSWCMQRGMSPLWPVIKLQSDSTSDC